MFYQKILDIFKCLLFFFMLLLYENKSCFVSTCFTKQIKLYFFIYYIVYKYKRPAYILRIFSLVH